MVFTDGGHLGSSVVICSPFGKNDEPRPVSSEVYEIEGSAPFKELFTVIMSLDSISGMFNLLSGCLYVVNLLPNLPKYHISLDSNPIAPLMIHTHTLLRQRQNPIYLQHLRSHQNLPFVEGKQPG